MDSFILFDVQFRIFKTVEQLYDLHLSLNEIDEVTSFLKTSNRHETNATMPVATTFITILNDTLKYLTKGASEVPSWVLDRLEMVFGPCQKFDLQYESIILFRPDIDNQKINESSIQQLVDMFNSLIEYKQNEVSKVSQYWPIALSILAFCCAFYFLEKTYKQVKYNIPLSDNQKNRFVEYLGRLHDILEQICQNLKDNQMDNFNANIRILDLLENDYVPLLKELNKNLKNQLRELRKRKDDENFRAIKAAFTSGVSLVTFLGTIALDVKPWKQVFNGVAIGVSGGYALHKASNVKRLDKVIEEYSCTLKIFGESQKFLSEVQEFVDNNVTEDPARLMLYQQFRSFRVLTSKLKHSIAELK